MARLAQVSLLSFCSGSPRDQETGLLGWVTLEVDRLFILNGVALRRTRDGCLALSFPERRDSAGRRHPLIRPLNDRARRDIERQVIDAIGLGGGGER